MKPIKKNLFVALVTIWPMLNVYAAPVMNENVASSGVIVIYPDSVSAHRYYMAPNLVEISKDVRGVPVFSYVETSQGLFGTAGIMQMTLSPAYTQSELDAAMKKILDKDPGAEFSALPFIESKLLLTGELPQLIRENQCNHTAGLVGQMQACNLILTNRGRKIWYNAIEQKKIFTTLQFEYSVMGVVRNANGAFSDQKVSHGVAAVIDGRQLAEHPELILKRDSLNVLEIRNLNQAEANEGTAGNRRIEE